MQKLIIVCFFNYLIIISNSYVIVIPLCVISSFKFVDPYGMVHGKKSISCFNICK